MKEMSGRNKLGLAAIAAVIVGAFLPWWSVLGFHVNGIQQGDGAITLALAAVAGALIVFARNTKITPVMGVLCGLGIAGVALYHVIDTSTQKLFGATIGMSLIGSGLWITLLAGIALVGIAAYGLRGTTNVEQSRVEA
jgi:tellurite resistance protein TehA-like permease